MLGDMVREHGRSAEGCGCLWSAIAILIGPDAKDDDRSGRCGCEGCALEQGPGWPKPAGAEQRARAARCKLIGRGNLNYLGYGQIWTPGKHR